MATLYHLKIQSFRGIDSFEQKFNKGLTCIIGRGDSGKTTVLDAISYVFSAKWIIHFYDSDFHLGNIENSIIIEGTVLDISEKLVAKYGSHIRGVLNDEIVDDLEDESNQECIPALTIRLTVTKSLEPKWEVITQRDQEPKPITSADRALLNCDFINDYNDRHFSLNKGNPLYSMNKSFGDDVPDDNNLAIDILRETRTKLNEIVDGKFQDMISSIQEKATLLGIDTPDIQVLLDHKDITIGENKISLHENDIPFRQKGKGTKRLLSLAIQLSNINDSGIILIDEIEQGLEPDRVQHLVKRLSKESGKQIILTTHSSNVITELTCKHLKIMRPQTTFLLNVDNALQNSIRSNPAAFFAKRLLVCEGATEVGICRALNTKRIQEDKLSLSNLGIVLVDGGGNRLLNYVKAFKELQYDCLLFCDSDVEGVNAEKQNIEVLGVKVVDCENGFAIEQQIFNDATDDQIKALIEYCISIDDREEKSLFDSVNSKLPEKMESLENWLDNCNDDRRNAYGICAKDKGWYKRIDHGEVIGEIVLSSLDEIDGGKRLRKIFEDISSWIGE